MQSLVQLLEIYCQGQSMNKNKTCLMFVDSNKYHINNYATAFLKVGAGVGTGVGSGVGYDVVGCIVGCI